LLVLCFCCHPDPGAGIAPACSSRPASAVLALADVRLSLSSLPVPVSTHLSGSCVILSAAKDLASTPLCFRRHASAPTLPAHRHAFVIPRSHATRNLLGRSLRPSPSVVESTFFVFVGATLGSPARRLLPRASLPRSSERVCHSEEPRDEESAGLFLAETRTFIFFVGLRWLLCGSLTRWNCACL